MEEGKGRNVVRTNEQIKHWLSIKHQYLTDIASVEAHKDIYQQRVHVQQEMLQVLNSFLDGTITLREFNHVFQKRTHDEWNILHLRGMSGGMFLNKLVKYVPEEDIFAHLLRMILRVPADQQDGQRHMRAFVRFLEGIIAARQATRSQLQPARTPFFLSIWWHIQDVETWPIFYLEVRHTLLEDAGTTGNILQDPVEAYFVCKTLLLELKQILGLTIWELEQLLVWYHASKSRNEAVSVILPSNNHVTPSVTMLNVTCPNLAHTIDRKGNMAHKKVQGDTRQTSIQWLLAKIGLKIGCSVWIAIDDHEKIWNEERLGDLSLPSLPILADSAFLPVINRMDVLWLRKNEVVAAYQVSLDARAICKNLVQLSDLAMLFPKRDIQLCIVTLQEHFEAVRIELMHPVFHHHDLHNRSKVIIQEYLVQHAEHILRWANSPSVIDDLILHLSTKEQ
jgi:hypothetical protein